MVGTRILEIRLGSVKTVGGLRSGIFKEAVAGSVQVSIDGLVGDEVADRRHHGGQDQALLALSAGHLGRWAEEGRSVERGAFGENLSLEGFEEHLACIGDVLEGDEVRLQISHPRIPCETLTRRLGDPAFLPRIWETARGGFYLRVLREGSIRPGEVLRLAGRPRQEWTVLRALHAHWRRAQDPAEAARLAEVPELSLRWRERLGAQDPGADR